MKDKLSRSYQHYDKKSFEEHSEKKKERR